MIVVNRAERRRRAKMSLRLKGHKLDHHHKMIKKRRAKKGYK